MVGLCERSKKRLFGCASGVGWRGKMMDDDVCMDERLITSSGIHSNPHQNNVCLLSIRSTSWIMFCYIWSCYLSAYLLLSIIMSSFKLINFSGTSVVNFT